MTGPALVDGAGWGRAEYETGPEAITLLLVLAAGASHARGISMATASYQKESELTRTCGHLTWSRWRRPFRHDYTVRVLIAV